MTKPVSTSPETPPLADAPAPRLRALALLAFALVAGVAALAALRTLSTREAEILLRVLDAPESVGPAKTWSVEIQRAWSWAAGCMERPSRALGVLSAATGVFGLAILLGRDRRRRSLLALASIAALPLFWDDATAIGGSAPAFAALVLVVALAEAGGLAPRAAAWVALAVAAALPFLAPLTGRVTAPAADAAFLSARAVDAATALLSPGGPPAAGYLRIAVAAAGVLLLAAAAGAGRDAAGFVDAMGVAGLFAAFGLQRIDGRTAADPRYFLLAALVPAACFASLPARRTRLAKAVGVVIAIAAAIAAAHAAVRVAEGRGAFASSRTPSASVAGQAPYRPGDRRAALDWVHDAVTPPAWLVLSGPERAVDRYYERVGHRTGLESILVPEESARSSLVSRAILTKPALVVLIDADPEIVAALSKRYAVLTTEGAPPGITVLYFKP